MRKSSWLLVLILLFSPLVMARTQGTYELINQSIEIDTLTVTGPVYIVNSTITLTNPELSFIQIEAYSYSVVIQNSTISYNGSGVSYLAINRGFVSIENLTLNKMGSRYKVNQIYRPQSICVDGLFINNSRGSTMFKEASGEINNINITNVDPYSNNVLLFQGGSPRVKNVDYTIPYMKVSAFTVIAVEATRSIVLDNVNGVGKVNVHSPHFHVLCTGVDKYPALGVVIQNSSFFGGGNGACTGWDITYLNCTFTSCTDGTEVFHPGKTVIIDTDFVSCTDSAINLQNGALFDFIRCNFTDNQYPVNIANGVANLVNCTFSDGAKMFNLGNNKDTLEPVGVLNQYWIFPEKTVKFVSTYSENRDVTLCYAGELRLVYP